MLATDTKWPWSEFHVVVPVHVGIAGNERSDFEARQATLGNMVFNALSFARDLLPIAKQRMLDEWQKSWEVGETGKFSHSIFPTPLRPWFEEWRTESKLITTASRIISGNCGVRAHLNRSSIVDRSMRLSTTCSRFSSQRKCLIQRLLLSGVYEEGSQRVFYVFRWMWRENVIIFYVNAWYKALVCRYSDPTMALWPRVYKLNVASLKKIG
jgi:hypothetical protein